MALTKIKLANKKAKREQKRRALRAEIAKDRRAMKIRNKRMRKMMIAGRREDLKRREGQKQYIKQLEGEVLADGEA